MMLLVILLFGAAITLLGLIGILNPVRFIRVVNGIWKKQGGLYLAIGFRLLFGLLLLASAAESRFPLAFQILGAVSLIAAGLIPLMGRSRIEKWVGWWIDRSPAVIRGWSLGALVFGLFLVYGSL